MHSDSKQSHRYHTAKISGSRIWQCLVIIAVLSCAIRGAIVLSGPWVEGDALVYANVARNILYNGCVAIEKWPALGCNPHWGGNQLPGYPAFVAASWFLFGENIAAPLLVQSLIFSVSLCYLCWSLNEFGLSRVCIWCVGVALAISPSLAGWSRTLLTETLSIAATLWVLAELVRSLAENKFRTWTIGLACLVGFFLRYDFVCIALPICLCGLALHGPWETIKKGLLVLLVVGLPFGAWTVRSIGHGLSTTPPFGFNSEGREIARGPLAWVATWLSHQYQLATSVWPLATESYIDINFPNEAFNDSSERERVQHLLNRLRKINSGEPIPPDIDNGFAELAAERINSDPVGYYLRLPLKRLAMMWINPAASMGWPGTLGTEARTDIRKIIGQSGILAGSAIVVVKYPAATLQKGLSTVWRLISICLALFTLAVSFHGAVRQYRLIIWICVIFVLVRCAVFSQTLLVETRYLSPALAWSDVAAAIGFGWLIGRFQSE